MRIEEEIRQSRPFANDHERGLINIMYTSNYLSNKLKELFQPYGITPKQYNILRILKGAKSALTTSEIRERMIDKMSDITRLVDRMIIKGWVEKSSNSEDKRLVDIEITAVGKALLTSIMESERQSFQLLGALSDNQAKVLNELLDQIRKD